MFLSLMVNIPWWASNLSESLHPHFCPSLLRVSIDEAKSIWPTKWPTLQYFIFSPALTISRNKTLFLFVKIVSCCWWSCKFPVLCHLQFFFPIPVSSLQSSPKSLNVPHLQTVNHKCHNLSNAREYFQSTVSPCCRQINNTKSVC